MSRKIEVAIFSRALMSNGATKSLVELLKRVDLNKYSIYLYVLDFHDQVHWIEEIPKEIKIMDVPRYVFKFSVIFDILKHPIHFLKALWAGRKLRGRISEIEYMKYTAARLPKLSRNFDIAISYRHFDIDIFYVCKNITAKHKYFWIHGIQKMTSQEIEELGRVYHEYDAIFPVSETALQSIVHRFSKIENKCRIAYCTVDSKEILKKANDGKKFDIFCEKGVRILTVGRLSEEKGMVLDVEACIELKNKGYEFLWLIVGDGPERKKLEAIIEEEKLEDVVKLVGNLDNPYGLLSSCDIYVQPSLMESYGLSINEAKIFNKPIVCTDIPAAREQLQDGITGLLVEPTGKAISKAIERYMNDLEFKNYVIEHLSKENKCHFESVEIFNSLPNLFH